MSTPLRRPMQPPAVEERIESVDRRIVDDRAEGTPTRVEHSSQSAASGVRTHAARPPWK
jgi:hypothetical protein